MDSDKMIVISAADDVAEARSTWERTPTSVVAWPADLNEASDVLEESFDDGCEGFIVAGGDDLVGQVVTAYWRRSSLGVDPLRLWPVDGGETLVADHGDGVISAARAARQMRRGVSDWRQEQVGTIKVTSSTERAAWYGFSFAAGWLYRAAQARRQARGGAGNLVSAVGQLATDTLSEDDDTPVAMRVAIDHEPTDARGGSMMVSTLKQTYFGLGTDGDGAVLWEKLSTPELLRHAVTPGVLKRKGRRARRFESLHLDTPQGWLLDGRLHGGEESCVVQVVPGPTVTLLRPAKGLRAMAGRFGSRR